MAGIIRKCRAARFTIAMLVIALVGMMACENPTESELTGTGPIVYITETGTKYHLSGCQYLSQSKIAIRLSEAKRRGYTPCSVCNPPPAALLSGSTLSVPEAESGSMVLPTAVCSDSTNRVPD